MKTPDTGAAADLGISGTWLIEQVDGCTCCGVPPHEAGCGWESLVDLSMLPGWAKLRSHVVATKLREMADAIEPEWGP